MAWNSCEGKSSRDVLVSTIDTKWEKSSETWVYINEDKWLIKRGENGADLLGK